MKTSLLGGMMGVKREPIAPGCDGGANPDEARERQAEVVKRIEAEMALLRPHAERLLYGPEGRPTPPPPRPKLNLRDDEDERAFLRMIRKAAREMGRDMKALAEHRKEPTAQEKAELLQRVREIEKSLDEQRVRTEDVESLPKNRLP